MKLKKSPEQINHDIRIFQSINTKERDSQFIHNTFCMFDWVCTEQL